MPVRPTTASDASNAAACSVSAIPVSMRTTSRGVVRFSRESPEPSAIAGEISNWASVSRMTRPPAAVEPSPPNCEPMLLIRISAM